MAKWAFGGTTPALIEPLARGLVAGHKNKSSDASMCQVRGVTHDVGHGLPGFWETPR